MAWKHDDLAADLAAYLRGNDRDRLVWCDMQLGPAGSPRPDVYVIGKSYSKFTPFAYECKISRSDFFADANVGKWQKYYAFASAVVFAVPDGLVKSTELPDGAGLIVRKDAVWRMARAPRVNVLDNLPRTAWMKLVMDGLHRVERGSRKAESEYLMRERAFKKALGDEIAKLMSDRDTMKWRIENEISEHKKRLELIGEQNRRERARANEKDEIASREYDHLCDLLGLPRGTNTWQISGAIERAIRALDADQRILDLVAVIDAAQNSLAQAKLRVSARQSAEAA
ncbi:MAG: hypothetical protein ACTHJQ_22790 [Rhizobiaceae bacterium]